MLPPPGDDLDLDTLVLQAVRWHVPDRTYKTRNYLYPQTLTTMACACQRPELLKELIRGGACENLPEALDQAIWWYSDACVEILLQAGVIPTDNALGIALKDGRWELIFRLLQHGGNVMASFQGGATLLHLAAWLQSVEGVTQLLALGLPVNIQDAGGRTPLLRACERWRPEIAECSQALVRRLLEHGANPNLQDNRGMTALMLAAGASAPDLFQLLSAAGADPTLRNLEGLQAWEYARQCRKSPQRASPQVKSRVSPL